MSSTYIVRNSRRWDVTISPVFLAAFLVLLDAASVVAGASAWVELRTRQGCIYYEWTDQSDIDANREVDWKGACSSGKPISGLGTLEKRIRRGSGWAGRDFSLTGTFIDGVPVIDCAAPKGKSRLSYCKLPIRAVGPAFSLTAENGPSLPLRSWRLLTLEQT